MSKPLLKYSIYSRKSRKIGLYLFIAFCAVVFGGIYGMYIPLLPLSNIKFMLIPILFLILLCIWMIPERKEFLENPTRYGLYIFLTFWLIWPPYLSLVILPDNSWISPQRILVYFMLIMMLLSASISKKTKHILHENYNENRGIYICIFVLLFASFASVFSSNNLAFSFTGFVKDVMFNFLVFFLGAALINQAKYLKIIFLICIFSALILGLMSFYENTLSQTIWSYHIPRNFFVDTEDMQKILSPRFRFNDYRVKGSSLTSLEYAELLSYTLPMCLYYLLNNKGKFLKLIMVITILIIFYAIVVSRSRLGLVGALVSISSYSYLIAMRNWRINKKSLVGPALLTLYPAGLAALGLLIGFSTTLTNLIFGGAGHASSTSARSEMWVKGLPLIAKKPLFGHGLYMGGSTLNYITPAGVRTIDTYILSIVLEIGVVGMLAFIILFILGSIKASKAYAYARKDDEFSLMGAAIVSIFMAFLVIKMVLSQRYNHTLLFLLLGVATHFKYLVPNIEHTTKAKD